MALKQKAEEYFSSLNPMANRICEDLNETKLSYDKLWETLPYEEQQQILSQSIIKPEISLKYGLEDEELEDVHDYAAKMIIDDNYSYRDEHSAPFSFRTQSQRDLSMFPKKKTTPKKPLKKVQTKVAPKPAKVAPQIPKVAPKVLSPAPKVNNKVKVISPCPQKVKKVAIVIPQESLEDDEDDSTSLSHILPKTGLDLLDNW